MPAPGRHGLDRRRLTALAGPWLEPLSVSAAVVLALLAAKPRLGPLATALATWVGPRIGSTAPRLEPYAGFLVVAACAALGTAVAVALVRRLRRWPVAWALPIALIAALEAAAHARAAWMVGGGLVAVVAMAPLVSVRRVRPVAEERHAALATLVCLACEAACVGNGVWFPMSRTAGLVRLLWLLAAPAAVAVVAALLFVRGERRARAACAGLPALGLPLVGLERNPTIVPTLVVVGLFGLGLVLLARLPARTAALVAWTRRASLDLALPAVTLWLLVPWRFRDMVTADSNGHESQHLGWLNSMSFGKWMMADAGFTYGPLREYALGALAALQGGLTLEHVRVAYVAVNVAGYLCLFGAMRLVARRQILVLLVGTALLVTHSIVSYWLIYFVNFGTFGWADTARAGLATLAVVAAFPPDRASLGDRRARRRREIAAGALAAAALLYSHDFGAPAILATVVGLGSFALVARGGEPLRARAREALVAVAAYGAGIAAVLVPFVLAYAVGGRLVKLGHGYRWAVAVSKGATPFSWPGGGFPLGESTFASVAALTGGAPDPRLGTKVLDYAFGPVVVAVGLAHVVVAAARGRIEPRTAVIAALTAFQAMVLYYAFVIPDASHVVHATTPGLVLLVALAAGGAGLEARVGRLVVPVGIAPALLAPLLWLGDGSARAATHERLDRLRTSEERPSFGEPYRYPFPRAGDEHVDDNLLHTAESIVKRSAPGDPVYVTTWMLGGGAEAFLSDRRNPTSFDKADEIASEALRKQFLAELLADPPKLIVGSFFDFLGDDEKRAIEQGWHPTDDPQIRERNR